ncbi:death domain-containing protein CRADD-like isoform X1 [Sinocyclocheilus grahami]|uniref:Death domain-containing protein CRADD-like n=1 Tax=Sinocyclocheilus grahami TaxID=75366 RepID=A0A672NFW2_SINGR|nr:PREDICTED: death domain-containing protein CRADD-like isoform X1 [Sinocyclocheilus grahami]
MDPKHKRLLRSQRLFLAEDLIVEDMIIQYLYQEGILTESHLEDIRSVSSNREKTLKLLDILPTRCSLAFHHFIQSLEKDFPWIRDKLLGLCAEDKEPLPPSFTVQCGVPDHILPTVPTSQHLNRLAAHLSSEWKSVLLDLGLSLADLYRCCADHPLAVQSQVLAGLVMWTQRNGREATVRRLLQSLQAADIPPSDLQQVFV